MKCRESLGACNCSIKYQYTHTDTRVQYLADSGLVSYFGHARVLVGMRDVVGGASVHVCMCFIKPVRPVGDIMMS